MADLQLTGPQMERLSDALLDAFDRNMLKQMLWFKLNKQLEHIVASDTSMRSIVFELIESAQREGWTGELLANAHDYNPGNPRLTAVYDEFFGPAVPVPEKPAREPAETVKTPLFKQSDILKLHELLLGANLASEDAITAMMGGMNLDFRATLPTSGAPSTRLLNILHILNSTGELLGGEIPMETFLANAAYLARALPAAAKLEEYLKSIRKQ
jgi:hypothetical protein